MKKIVLFDGECNFCHRSVQFIIKRDPEDYFRFASLQSKIGQSLIDKYKIPRNIDSLLLIDNNKWFAKSSAALHICKYLKGFWRLFFPLLIIPKPIRDLCYHLLAKNRYRLSDKKFLCMIPTPDIKKRFL